MKRTEKDAVIGEFTEQLRGASAFYLTDFTGLSVKQMTQFRARLRKAGVQYVVVKNTLAQRALQELDLPDVASFFTGPTGVVIGREDAVAAAKVLTTFAREFGDRPAVKVGVVDKRECGPDEVKRLAELPPREVLLAQLAGGLQAPMARLAGGMTTLLSRFAVVLEARRLYVQEHGLDLGLPPLAAIATVIDSWRLQAWLDERQQNPSEPLKIGERYTLSVGFSRRESEPLYSQTSENAAIRAELVLLSSSVEFEPARPAAGESGVDVQETTIGHRRMWTARTEIRLAGRGSPEIPRLFIRPKAAEEPRIELLMFARGELYREASMILSVER